MKGAASSDLLRRLERVDAVPSRGTLRAV